jgi:glucuronoarabinoxylan endo-1,4-beta-xylanase
MDGSDSSDACTVSLQRTRQKIDGFGICQAFHQADHVQSYPEPLRTEILDLLFSQESGAGYVRAKLVMPETEHFGLERASYFTPALQNPSASSVIGIHAQHGYGGRIEHLGLPEGLGKSIWLSEICTTVKESNDSSMVDGIRWARSIHDYLTIPEVSAYCYFWGASLYYSGAISLVGLNLEERQIVRNKRLFVIGNYSRFVRPGYLRIEAAPSSGASVPLTAFADADRKKVVLVAFNERAAARSIVVSVQGISDGTFACFRTSETENLDRLPGVSCTGGALRITLPPLSVTTLVGP